MNIRGKKGKNHDHIIVCSDGTGNSGGGKKNTNVWRIYDAIDVVNQDQISFYDDGVGTNKNTLFKLFGLAFGWGLSRNIRQLYKEVVMHYHHHPTEPNKSSQLYLFGFSRGAHTIRLLAELICTFGILNRNAFDNERELDRAIKELQRQFKAAIRLSWIYKLFSIIQVNNQKTLRTNTESRISKRVKQFDTKLKRQLEQQVDHISVQNKNQSVIPSPHIRFVGVWDTVSAVGMPIDEMRDNYFFANHAFVDNKLHPHVDQACHALAIDEKRHTFKPELWDQSDDVDQARIQQVWFSGVHANVGGGYAKDQLALVSLKWMIQEAEKAGLVFSQNRKDEINNHANHNGQMYDSRSGVAALYRYKPRNLVDLTLAAQSNRATATLKVHESAYSRVLDSPAEYAPINLPDQGQLNNGIAEITIDEHTDQASAFVAKSAKDNPWNIIWLQRWLHSGFMAFFIALIYLGVQLTKATPTVLVNSTQPTLNWLQKMMQALCESNPMYVTNKILPGYINKPEMLMLMLAVFLVLMWLRATFNKHLNNIGNTLWNRAPYNQHKVNANRIKTNPLHHLFLKLAQFWRQRTLLNQSIIPHIHKKIIPIIVSVAFFTVILYGLLILAQVFNHLIKLIPY